MPKVRIERRILSFPAICPGCGRPADPDRHVDFKTCRLGTLWVPVCRACAARQGLRLAAFGGLMAVVLLGIGVGLFRALETFPALSILGFAATIPILFAAAKACDRWLPVVLVDSRDEGSRRIYVFRARSEAWTRELERLNPPDPGPEPVRTFEWSDAWIFAALPLPPSGAELPEIIAAADYLNHAIPSRLELESALGGLLAAGFIRQQNRRFSMAPDLAAAHEAQVGKLSPVERVNRTLKWLNALPRGEPSPGDARLDDGTYQDAVRRYRRRAGG